MRRSEFGARFPGRIVDVTVTVIDPVSKLPVDISTPSFIPDRLPRDLEISGSLSRRLEEATHLLGVLREAASRLPNPHMLRASFARREAVSSSRIEGTQTSFEGLLLYEQGGLDDTNRSDAQEVLNYVRALDHGFAQPLERGISLSLIREIHALLMEGSDEFRVGPGRFRRGTVFVGGRSLATARYVPPPASALADLMIGLERDIVEVPSIPRLVWIGMIHYQFEAIHPFNDGNGRTGRVLISLLLRQAGLLDGPVLHLSNFIERSKPEYVDGLTRVSLGGEWAIWNEYFIDAVATEADRAVGTVQAISDLERSYVDQLRATGFRGGAPIVSALFSSPLQSITSAAKAAGVSYNTAKTTFERMVALGMLEETRGTKRNRIFRAPEILRVLEAQFDEGHPQ